MTEREKMLAGELYRSADPALVAARRRARQLCRQFNDADVEDFDGREAVLRQLLGAVGPGFEIEPPFRCDYGANVRLGRDVYINFGCVMLDCGEITIGDGVMLAPNVQLYCAGHPLNAEERLSGMEFGKPIHIGRRAWVGGGSILLPGVSVGEDSVIGAGSVVTRDVPPGVVAVGNPCRVRRAIRDSDRLTR